jgi:DNA-binding PadR family transcriptional regulator
MHRHFFGGRPHHHRGPFGGHGRPEAGDHGGREHGRHGWRRPGRFFDHGDLRFVVLKLIADHPRHGYELIKAIEEQAGGAYTPSPGVIYPTLTLLEETGLVTSEADGGKKLYSITPEGEAQLTAAEGQVKGIFQRMAEAASASAVFSPQILRARENLRTALRHKLTGGALSKDQIAAICDALDAAAKAVERS